MGRGLILRCKLACRGLLFPQLLVEAVVLCGISPPFGRLSPARGNITHVLLTRAPLYRGRSPFSCDLHVLGAPLTFVLSQDQTLQLNLSSPRAPWGSCPAAHLGLWLLEFGESLLSVLRRYGGS